MTSRWRYYQEKTFFANYSHIIWCTLLNIISICSLNTAEPCDVGHAHVRTEFPFANSPNVANLLFRTPPRQFHQFAQNFAHSICGPFWQKVIKRILICQRILKLLNNNFLWIRVKTGSVAYLHIGVSKWRETEDTTSPWAPKALCKILAHDH